jgi:hypothetical protein
VISPVLTYSTKCLFEFGIGLHVCKLKRSIHHKNLVKSLILQASVATAQSDATRPEFSINGVFFSVACVQTVNHIQFIAGHSYLTAVFRYALYASAKNIRASGGGGCQDVLAGISDACFPSQGSICIVLLRGTVVHKLAKTGATVIGTPGQSKCEARISSNKFCLRLPFCYVGNEVA